MFDEALMRLPGAKRTFVFACFIAALEAVAIIGCAVSLGTALYHLWCAKPLAEQVTLLALFGGCFMAQALLHVISDSACNRFAERTVTHLRRALLEKTFSQGFSLVAKRGSATLTALALDDLDAVHTYLRRILPRLANAVVITLMVVIALWCIDWVSGLIALLTIPVTGLFMALLGSMSQKAAISQRGVYEQLSNAFADALRGLDTLKRLGISKAWEAVITNTSEKFRQATMKVLRIAILSGSVLDLIATLSLAAVAVMLGFRLVDGTVGLHAAFIVLILVPDCFKPIRAFASDFHSSLDGKNALAAIISFLHESDVSVSAKQVAESTVDPTTLQPLQKHLIPQKHTGEPIANASLTLTLDNVSFSYDPTSKPVLSAVQATFHAPLVVGVVGPSGVGKSTLLGLVTGFLTPTSGTCRVSQNGQELTPDQWRSEVLYLPQNPFIFHGTLRDNIAFYTPHVSDEAIMQAIEQVGLTELYRTLDCGLDTMIGEAARQLSGGESHRVALCRALLDTSRKILVFDEPTAHLDIETEIALKEPMQALMKDRLVFFGTHRLHWLDSFDMVVRLTDGTLRITSSPAHPSSQTLDETLEQGSLRPCRP